MKLLLAFLLVFPALAQQAVTLSSSDPLLKPPAKKQASFAAKAVTTGTNTFTFPATVAAGGTAPGAYRYYVVAKADPAPLKKGGFSVSFPLNVSDFAGKEEGYSLSDTNGWPYRAEQGVGSDLRVYRLKNALNGQFQLHVRTQ